MLHIIRKDVLLHALGGFADPPEEPAFGPALPVWVLEKLAAVAEKPRAERGEILQLAERSGRSGVSLRQTLLKLRRGWRPAYLDAA